MPKRVEASAKRTVVGMGNLILGGWEEQAMYIFIDCRRKDEEVFTDCSQAVVCHDDLMSRSFYIVCRDSAIGMFP